jgi:hypothetical protein
MCVLEVSVSEGEKTWGLLDLVLFRHHYTRAGYDHVPAL